MMLGRELSVPGEPIGGASVSSGCKVPHHFSSAPTARKAIYLSSIISPYEPFSSSDQYMPAGLIRMLLLIAGVERNPGPDEDSPVRQDYFVLFVW